MHRLSRRVPFAVPGPLVVVLSLCGLSLPVQAAESFELTLTHEENVAVGAFVGVENLLGSITVGPGMNGRRLSVEVRVVAEAPTRGEARDLARTVRLRRDDAAGGATHHVVFPVDRYTAFRPPRSETARRVVRWITPLLRKSTVAAEYDDRLVEVGRARGATALAVHVKIGLPLDVRSSFRQIAGSVTVEGLRGDVALESVNGDLDARQIYGDLVARTGSGALRVWKFHGKRFDVRSSSGDIALTDIRADEARVTSASGWIRGQTLGGASIYIGSDSGDMELVDVESNVFDIETVNGKVDLTPRLDRVREGSIRTASGDVTLRVGELSSFDLEAETGNGSATFRGVKLDLDDFRDDGGHFVRGRKGSRLRVATGGGDLVVRLR